MGFQAEMRPWLMAYGSAAMRRQVDFMNLLRLTRSLIQ